MKKALLILALTVATLSFGQSKWNSQDISVNGFRNPSIGLEYRYHQVSAHAGYYMTAFKAGETSKFIRVGGTFWFGALGKKPIPSSFYTSLSYMRGFNREFENKGAVAFEFGFRWMVWKGLNLRIGAVGITHNFYDMRINPTPGISYTFIIKGKQAKTNN